MTTPSLRVVCGVVALVCVLTEPALAQKRGGTLSVGMELDIAGFDPLKVAAVATSDRRA